VTRNPRGINYENNLHFRTPMFFLIKVVGLDLSFDKFFLHNIKNNNYSNLIYYIY